MKPESEFSTDIPMTFHIRSGKTVMVAPDGSRAIQRREATIDNSMVKVIARGFRWQKMLVGGEYATLGDLARAEKISRTYVSRIVRLAYLAPDIVEAIMDGRHPSHLTMKDLMDPFPMEWQAQREWFSGALGRPRPASGRGHSRNATRINARAIYNAE